MSSDNAQQDANDGEADASNESSKKESFVVMFDDDDVAASAETEDAGTDHETDAVTSAAADNSGDGESVRAPGSFVVLLEDEDPEDEIDSMVSMSEDGNCTVNFPEDIGIRHIMKIKTALSRALEASNVTYDASNVDIVDTSSIQLLHAHGISLKDNNIPSQWAGRSERFAAVEKRLGFDLSQ